MTYPCPTSRASASSSQYVRFRSGVKRYVFRDQSHPKAWNVVEAGPEAGQSQRRKRRFHEVEVHGDAQCVTRPGAGLVQLDGQPVSHFLVTTAALKCWRVPAADRDALQPYRAVTR